MHSGRSRPGSRDAEIQGKAQEVVLSKYCKCCVGIKRCVQWVNNLTNDKSCMCAQVLKSSLSSNSLNPTAAEFVPRLSADSLPPEATAKPADKPEAAAEPESKAAEVPETDTADKEGATSKKAAVSLREEAASAAAGLAAAGSAIPEVEAADKGGPQ